MPDFITRFLSDCFGRSPAQADNDLAGTYASEEQDHRLNKIKPLFEDVKKANRAVIDFSTTIDAIISANAIDGGQHANEVDHFDALFSAFDSVKAHIKCHQQYRCTERYSVEKNAILFCIDDVEIKHIQLQNDSGTDDIILDGVRVDQWDFLSACYKRELQYFDQMIDALFPVYDLSTLEKEVKAKSLLEYSDLQNCCPEKSALVLANMHHVDCEFTLSDLYRYKSNTLEQIDITPPLSFFSTGQSGGGSFFEGNSEAAAMDYLNGLNKTVPHLLRLGENDGTGHNMILSCEQGEWYLYEGLETKHKITEKDEFTAIERLTDIVKKNYIKPELNWGREQGQISIFTLEATEQGTEALISYIKTCRTQDEEVALENLYLSR